MGFIGEVYKTQFSSYFWQIPMLLVMGFTKHWHYLVDRSGRHQSFKHLLFAGLDGMPSPGLPAGMVLLKPCEFKGSTCILASFSKVVEQFYLSHVCALECFMHLQTCSWKTHMAISL